MRIWINNGTVCFQPENADERKMLGAVLGLDCGDGVAGLERKVSSDPHISIEEGAPIGGSITVHETQYMIWTKPR